MGRNSFIRRQCQHFYTEWLVNDKWCITISSNYLGHSYRRLVEILCEKHEVKLSKTIHENIEMWCPNYRCNVSTLPMDVIAFSRWHLETCQTKHELISSILSVDTIVTTALQLVVGDARYINTSLYIEILLSIINSQHQSSVYKLPLGILEKLLHSFPNVADQTGSNSVLKVAFLNVLAFHRRHQHNLTEYCTEFWRWRQKLQTVGSPVISEIWNNFDQCELIPLQEGIIASYNAIASIAKSSKTLGIINGVLGLVDFEPNELAICIDLSLINVSFSAQLLVL